jgi:hypothetical protein
MLETNTYVRCLIIDFAKAFNTVDHAIVLRKVNGLNMPASIKNWIIQFLTGRSQLTELFVSFSECLEINLSIVQGSGIGPSLYIFIESDLHTLSAFNVIFKFADDTMLVSDNCDVTLQDELKNLRDWAKSSNMIINHSKTK